MRKFEIQLALRHLRAGGWQTVLTVGGVAIAVTLVVFISSMIYGIQRRIGKQLTDFIPQVTIKPPEPKPARLEQVLPQRKQEDLLVTEVEERQIQRKFIEEWPEVVATLRQFPHVAHLSPAVTGQAFIRSGSRSFGITLYGANPQDQEPITSLNEYLVVGRYIGLTPEEMVLGWTLAEDLGVTLGDRVRVTSTEGASQSFTIAGLYDTGQDFFDRVRVFITLRAAQSLFGTGNYVTAISLELDDLYQANNVADRIENTLPFTADSWMREFVQYVSIMAAQRGTNLMITVFSLLASSLGIASVLIVSVLQKSKQIGILKAMGARRAQILLVFTLEGLFIAVIGAVVGALLGSSLIALLAPLRQPPRPSGRIADPLFPVAFSWWVLLSAMAAAIISTVIASIIPARRAARLDPVEVIRGG